MVKATRDQRRECPLTSVTERGVPQVMPQGDRIEQGVAKPQRRPDLAGDGADLHRVGQPGSHQGISGERHHLGLGCEATKRARAQNPVSVARKPGHLV